MMGAGRGNSSSVGSEGSGKLELPSLADAVHKSFTFILYLNKKCPWMGHEQLGCIRPAGCLTRAIAIGLSGQLSYWMSRVEVRGNLWARPIR